MVESPTRRLSYRFLCSRYSLDSLITSGETLGRVDNVPREEDGVCYYYHSTKIVVIT